MQINAVYDASVANAPAGYTTAIQAAIDYLDNLIVNNISLTINFGWGEVNGQSLAPGALGENMANGFLFTYSQVAAALAASAASADDRTALSTLPASDPTGGGEFLVTSAQAQALGLRSAISSPAGYIGLSSAYGYAFDPANRAVAGKYDAIAVLEHEITEVLGRTGSLGSAEGTSVWTPLDLFRYAAPGARELTPGAGYFSVDGQTMLLRYNDPTKGGDASDWDTSVVADAFGAGFSGREGAISPADLQELDVIGYTLRGASLPPPQLVATSPAAAATAVALGAPIVLSFNEPIRLGTGSVQIHDASTGAVISRVPITDAAQVSLSPATVVIRPAAGLPAGAHVYVTVDAGAITDLNGTAFTALSNATSFSFTDQSAAQTASTLVGSVLRASATDGAFSGLGASIITGLTTGSLAFGTAVSQVSQAASGTTSVAILTYEFFMGATPTAAGLDYLVSPTGPNPNNLNSTYYQAFNDTNRYINFAVNLGKSGGGATAFAGHYGGLSLSEAVSQEYAKIFGSTPSAAKLDALINATVESNGVAMTRADYLALYGGDGPNGLGTKAAFAGWLLAEAVHSGLGVYATAETAYLSDLAQGHAPFNIDLVGVYHGTPYLGG
jgi:hypothetical protein